MLASNLIHYLWKMKFETKYRLLSFVTSCLTCFFFLSFFLSILSCVLSNTVPYWVKLLVNISSDKITQFLYLQLFLSATIPLENRKEVYVGWFFEANYHVPIYNLTLFTEDEVPRTYRAMDRRGIYVMLENVFQK